MTLVLYREFDDEIKLFNEEEFAMVWLPGSHFIVWRTLTIAMSYGWEVIGEL